MTFLKIEGDIIVEDGKISHKTLLYGIFPDAMHIIQLHRRAISQWGNRILFDIIFDGYWIVYSFMCVICNNV